MVEIDSEFLDLRRPVNQKPRQSQYGHVGQSRKNYNAPRAYNKLDEVMADFRFNGFESPVEPENNFMNPPIINMGWDGQRPWSARTDLPQPPRSWTEQTRLFSRTHSLDEARQAREMDLQALLDIPQSMMNLPVKYLLEYAGNQMVECRFCKSNGEPPKMRQHRLKDEAGRILCPVLRNFSCIRCGATGDLAHTLKYCPKTSMLERQYSTAMMRGMRMSTARRRVHHTVHSCAEPGDAWAELLNKQLDDDQLKLNNGF